MISFGTILLANAYVFKGDWVRGLAHGEVAFEQAPTLGDRVWIQGWLGQELCRSGHPHRGIELLEPAVSVQREAQFYGSELFATSLGEGMIARTGSLTHYIT